MSQTSQQSNVSESRPVDPEETEGSGTPSAANRPNRAVRLRRWGLALADTGGVLAGILVAAAAGKLDASNWRWAALLIPTWILVAKLYNLYDRDHRRINHSTSEEIPSLISTAAVTIVMVKLTSEIGDPGLLPSSALLIAGGTSVVAVILLRSLVRRIYLALAHGERTVIVGSGPKAALVARRLRRQAGDRIDLIGYLTTEIGNHQTNLWLEELGLNELGDASNLLLVADRSRLARVVVADDSLPAKETHEIISTCRRAKVSLTLVPTNHEVLGPNTELNRIADVPMLDFHFSVPPRSTLVIKRAIDVICASFMLVLVSPLMALAVLLIKIDSPGPVFFRQVRIGKNGHRFNMIKLRTMVADAEKRLDEVIDLEALDEPAFKIRNDPRVTRIGSLLRRTSIDEIPQFVNVLSGAMSMVGPRPEEEAVVALYDERQRERLAVKPGLTGPMQVSGRGDLSFEERLALERDYLDNLTVTGDIAILIRTPRAVIRGNGAS